MRVSETPGGRADVGAFAVEFTVVHPDVELELRLLSATNGERWVDARSIRSILSYVPRLEGRLRLTIDRHRTFSLCALRLAVPKGESWANLHDATLAELGDASGVPVTRELKSVGAIDVGSRQALLEDSGRTRRRLIATFAHPNEEAGPRFRPDQTRTTRPRIIRSSPMIAAAIQRREPARAGGGG